ncbi:tyrosine-type recombinase/integrase [Nonomuraea basaltis]|uniref:tyrosine-type recombinase/integrase n=1 Tax=Nonomuraea basaltis TaxID=2495887 RepID=UPI00110C70B2|nr:tyrosine-type recombinase/integrase [Nonomuraea basaltis]TMR89296.1 hypothetical protein EJK15_61565 [Nonomuraea basaltis]
MEHAPLSAEIRRTYRSRVRIFLAWLADRAAGGIIAEIAQRAGLDDPTTAPVLRHTLATTLVRGKTDLVVVAEILGHARLETTRRYSLRPTPTRTRPDRAATSALPMPPKRAGFHFFKVV